MVGSYWVCHWKNTFWVGGCDGIGGLAYLLFCAAYWSRLPRVFWRWSRSCLVFKFMILMSKYLKWCFSLCVLLCLFFISFIRYNPVNHTWSWLSVLSVVCICFILAVILYSDTSCILLLPICFVTYIFSKDLSGAAATKLIRKGWNDVDWLSTYGTVVPPDRGMMYGTHNSAIRWLCFNKGCAGTSYGLNTNIAMPIT